MNTARTGSPSTPSIATSSSKESTCRPKALRRTVMSMPPKVVSMRVAAGVDPVGEQDHAGARAVDGQAVRDALAQRLEQLERAGQLDDRRRLTARQHQAVDGGQLARAAHGHGLDPGGRQRAQVFADVALQGQHTDGRHGTRA